MGKLNLTREFLIDCKNKIMQGQSISSLEKDVNIDRKTLKKNILGILSEKEKEEFQKVLNNNFRRNRKSVKTIKKEQMEKDYEKAIKILIQIGVTTKDIDTIFESLSPKQHTKMKKDTFAIKLVEIFNFIEERNKGMKSGDKGYIKKNDVINMILRESRFMTNDVERKIKPMCDILDTWSPEISRDQINRYIVTYPMIFKNSIQKLKIALIIGDNFFVKVGKRFMSLSKYIITENPYLVRENSKIFLEKMCKLSNSYTSGIIPIEEIRYVEVKSNEEYELPEYTDDNTFRKEIKKIITKNKRSNIQKGEQK